jgi:protein-tyrosine phosphatase
MDLAPRELVNTMPSIMFVCTGNIFRRMTAAYALKARLAPRSPIRVSSAGTLAMPQEMHPDRRAYLVQRGIDPIQHHQRRVSAELLHATDLAIALSTDHQSFAAPDTGRPVEQGSLDATGEPQSMSCVVTLRTTHMVGI